MFWQTFQQFDTDGSGIVEVSTMLTIVKSMNGQNVMGELGRSFRMLQACSLTPGQSYFLVVVQFMTLILKQLDFFIELLKKQGLWGALYLAKFCCFIPTAKENWLTKNWWIYHNDTYYMHRYLCDVLCFLSSGFVDVYARDHDAVQQHAEKILKVWAITSCWQIKREEERWQIKNYFRTYAQFNCIRNCNRIC